MILQAGPPEFSLVKEVTVFAIFCVIVIIAVLALEFDIKGEQRRERAQKNRDTDTEIFAKVEEYRNDFPDHAVQRSETAVRQFTGDFDCCRSDGSCRHDRPDGESVFQGI